MEINPYLASEKLLRVRLQKGKVSRRKTGKQISRRADCVSCVGELALVSGRTAVC